MRIVCLLLALWCMQCVYAMQRDPTEPVPYAVWTEADGTYGLSVSSILVAPHRRLALVNDQFMTVGDRISGMKVVAIAPDLVQFTGPDGKFAISLYDTVRIRER